MKLYTRTMKTAVEWLEEKIKEYPIDLDVLNYFEQAKEIHRVEIIEAYAQGSNDRLKGFINTDYYNETFEGGNK